ncbi:MAG: phosphopyruvate hydratase [Candidatus Stahlbacteria bacterium]|nr:MAG: phosphopyruvate hydratase [Candidatus Stahlbacteria bacterium]
MGSTIIDIKAREILDSRGNPTIEAECKLESGTVGRAAVPSGASTGTREALELRDNDNKRFGGKGVLKAVNNVNNIIAQEIIGKDCLMQVSIDKIMCELDGTKNKKNLGANAILSVSLSIAKAACKFLGIPLYRYLGGADAVVLPVPQCNIINGGEHADNNLDIQEFMIMPYGFPSFRDSIRCASEIFHVLKKSLSNQGLGTGVGDEGGFAPNLSKNQQSLDLIIEAIKKAGYQPEEEVGIAIDAAASEFYNGKSYRFEGKDISTDELISIYKDWVENYPIVSIEDGLAESDWNGWERLTKELGESIQIVGDDIFVTNTSIIKDGIKRNIANSVLIKLNQIGTVTETIEAIKLAKENGWTAVVSHRSGETGDVSIAHLAVGLNTGQIKSGSLSRSERVEKYNELIRIEEELGDAAVYKQKEVLSQ